MLSPVGSQDPDPASSAFFPLLLCFSTSLICTEAVKKFQRDEAGILKDRFCKPARPERSDKMCIWNPHLQGPHGQSARSGPGWPSPAQANEEADFAGWAGRSELASRSPQYG